jgi:PKD repeat protein
MKRNFIFSILCLSLHVGFSQTPVIDTVHTNKCALTGVVNSEIILIDNSPSQTSITSRIWRIKDANETVIQTYTPSTNDSISYLFSNPGTYTIELSVSWNNATAETASMTVNVYPQSIPAFVSSMDSILFNDKKDTICANNGGYLYLQDKSYTLAPFDTTKITNWEWKVGFVTSIEQNPTLQFEYPGFYDLSLKITNEFGCVSDTIFQDQVSTNEIITHFTNPADNRPSGSICNKTKVTFENNTQVLPYYYNSNIFLKHEWDWGDGDTSMYYAYSDTKADASHYYDLPNTTNKVAVKLKVTIVDPITLQSKGCSAEYEDTVIVTRPIADFTTEQNIFPCPQDGIIGGTVVTFNDQSEGDAEIITLWWFFGDTASGNANTTTGSPEENRYKNPSHIYWNPGKYNVLLIAQDVNGCVDSMFKEAYIYIGGPIGKVSYSPTDGCAPITVTFDFTVSQDPEFTPDAIVVNTDGAFDLTVTGDSPFFHSKQAHYNKPGKYIPSYILYKTVVVNGVEEVCEMRFLGEDTIHVVQLIPNFNVESSYYPGVPVTFENITTVEPPGTPVEYIWAFGNGDTAYTYNEGTTQYDSVGNYTVTLTVNAGKICSRNRTRTIEIVPVPPNNVSDFSKEKEAIKIYPNPTAGNLTIEFVDERQRYIQIFDANARVLYQQTHYEQIVQLSLKNYPAGNYIITINNVVYRKFTIMK